MRALIDPETRPNDLNRPGHIFPLRYRAGGVLKRAGHTEATVDLCRLAGKQPSGVLCEIVTDDKSGMARLPELEAFAEKHRLPIVSIIMRTRFVVSMMPSTNKAGGTKARPMGDVWATCSRRS